MGAVGIQPLAPIAALANATLRNAPKLCSVVKPRRLHDRVHVFFEVQAPPQWRHTANNRIVAIRNAMERPPDLVVGQRHLRAAATPHVIAVALPGRIIQAQLRRERMAFRVCQIQITTNDESAVHSIPLVGQRKGFDDLPHAFGYFIKQ